MEHFILHTTVFFGSFILLTVLLYKLSKKFTSVPYTVALLVVGYYAQWMMHQLNIDLHLELDANIIYHILLPILLFESAFNVNIHQFKIQFKTISFLATIGLLISVFVVAFTLAYLTGLPFEVALLFGAVISATDPIAVIALFKNLGGPKRLGLVADGESMFNDATGVIAFKLVSTFVVAQEVFNTDKLFSSFGDFTYVFLGSMIVGSIVGYLCSNILKMLRSDKLMITMFTVAFSLLVFNLSELLLHLSGVIAVVVASIVLGNFGKPRLPSHTVHFMAEFWENIGFFCISLVFFFATFNLDIGIFWEVEFMHIVAAIFAVLLARAVSIYAGVWVTNNVPFFKDEPNIPLSWQHILNWGGLRGVIPLVLVYAIPKDYQYYNELLAFTFGALLFTLIINGLTIKYLLLGLKLHLPKEEEKVIGEESTIFTLEESRKALKELDLRNFSKHALEDVERELSAEEKKHREAMQHYLDQPELLLHSFKVQALQIEREVANELHENGYINEDVIMDFETELDLQQDALDYPEVFRTADKQGRVKSQLSYRKMIQNLRKASSALPFFNALIHKTEKDVVVNRYMLLVTRLLTSDDVLWYLDYVKQFVKGNKKVMDGLTALEERHKGLVENNRKHLEELMKDYPELLEGFQKKVIYSLLEHRERHVH